LHLKNLLKRILDVFKGKNIDEAFFQYKSGVSHYYSGSKAQSGMIDYTFLLPGKLSFIPHQRNPLEEI
jgi:hypothetical protein